MLTSFLLAAVLHPESLQKAQAELDSVITSGRLPDFEDRRALVYCEALLMEVGGDMEGLAQLVHWA